MFKQPSPLDNQETNAKMLSLELSHEELLDKIGMETSYGGKKTFQNKPKKAKKREEELNVWNE